MNLIYAPINWTLSTWHDLLVRLGLPSGTEPTWAASIVLLVFTVRLLLLRGALRQARTRITSLALAPHLEQLKQRHKGDTAAFAAAASKLHRDNNHSPLAMLAPMLVQLPILLGLMHVLRHTITGPLGTALRSSDAWVPTLVAVVISSSCMLATQLLSQRNSPAPANDQQRLMARMMLWISPASALLSAVVMPLGVLVYFATSSLFTTGQQLLINRFHPISKVAMIQVRT